MKWFEFTQDNGDGSFSKLRFRTMEEAEVALEICMTTPNWIGDGEGVSEVDTEDKYFFSSVADLQEYKDTMKDLYGY